MLREGLLVLILIVLILYVTIPRFLDAQATGQFKRLQNAVNAIAEDFKNVAVPEEMKKRGWLVSGSTGYSVKNDELKSKTYCLNFDDPEEFFFITYYERQDKEQDSFLGYSVWTYRCENKQMPHEYPRQYLKRRKIKEPLLTRFRIKSSGNYLFIENRHCLFHPTNGLYSEGYIHKDVFSPRGQ